MTDRELLQMALNALEHYKSPDSTIKALRARLAQPEPATRVPEGDIRALKHRIHELEGEVVGYKQILDTQPEPAECDGGQCGIGGYCKECPKPLVKLKEMLEVQGRNGTWNYDPYFHGMYNGMEVMLAVLEGREPVFRGAPEKWLSKKEWVGLTDKEIKILTTQGRTDFSRPPYEEFYRAIEAKLKEKNA